MDPLMGDGLYHILCLIPVVERILLCTATNAMLYERFHPFPRRGSTGASLSSWLSKPGAGILCCLQDYDGHYHEDYMGLFCLWLFLALVGHNKSPLSAWIYVGSLKIAKTE